jgi:hypothetical protein
MQGSLATVVASFGAVMALLAPSEAHAVRFGLGVASEVTPLVIDAGSSVTSGSGVRLGFRPVLEVEANYYLSFGAYAPFTVYRTGDSEGAASSGAESVFGVSASGRIPFLRDSPPEEFLAYATARGGFSTINGRAGPFLGAALGLSVTWLSTGRGFFAEVGLSHAHVSDVPIGEVRADLNRYLVSFSVGLVFHLGGEDWRLGPKPLATAAP